MIRIFVQGFLLFLFSISIHGNIKFSSDHIEIHFPENISASGNASFFNDDINISAGRFLYNTSESTGKFQNNVTITYAASTLYGDEIFLNISEKVVTGKGNIHLKTSSFEATSDDLSIIDYKLAHLKNNVEIKRNGSQINSNGLVYNLETDTILSTDRVKLKFE